jgi:hypothetical protein
MNKETNEQNGNEKDISHCVLSWCGEHKMKAIAIALVVALASLSGVYWYQGQTPCTDITLELKWASGTPIKSEANPTITWYENEPVQLLITTSTTRGGVFKVTIESQEVGLVSFSKTVDRGYSTLLTEVVSEGLTGPRNPTENYVWVKAKINSKGFKDGVYVKATLDGSCKKEGYAFLKTIQKPTPPEPPFQERAWNWIEKHPNEAVIGAAIALIVLIIIAARRRHH